MGQVDGDAETAHSIAKAVAEEISVHTGIAEGQDNGYGQQHDLAHDIQHVQKQEFNLLGKGMLADGIADEDIYPDFKILLTPELGFDPFRDEEAGILLPEMLIQPAEFRTGHGNIGIVIPGDEAFVAHCAPRSVPPCRV